MKYIFLLFYRPIVSGNNISVFRKATIIIVRPHIVKVGWKCFPLRR